MSKKLQEIGMEFSYRITPLREALRWNTDIQPNMIPAIIEEVARLRLNKAFSMLYDMHKKDVFDWHYGIYGNRLHLEVYTWSEMSNGLYESTSRVVDRELRDFFSHGKHRKIFFVEELEIV